MISQVNDMAEWPWEVGSFVSPAKKRWNPWKWWFPKWCFVFRGLIMYRLSAFILVSFVRDLLWGLPSWVFKAVSQFLESCPLLPIPSWKFEIFQENIEEILGRAEKTIIEDRVNAMCFFPIWRQSDGWIWWGKSGDWDDHFCHPSTRSKAHRFMKVVLLSWSDDVLKNHFSFHSDQQTMGDHGYSMRVFSYQLICLGSIQCPNAIHMSHDPAATVFYPSQMFSRPTFLICLCVLSWIIFLFGTQLSSLPPVFVLFLLGYSSIQVYFFCCRIRDRFLFANLLQNQINQDGNAPRISFENSICGCTCYSCYKLVI